MGNYRATFYNVNGINLETRKRREHLSDADLQKNKQLLESFTKGNMEQGGIKHQSVVYMGFRRMLLILLQNRTNRII